jgi:hypothetical protein
MQKKVNTAEEDRKKMGKGPLLKNASTDATPVGPVGIVLVAIYLILFSIFLLYSIVRFWLPSVSSGGSSIIINFAFLGTFSVRDEVRLLIVIALSGALGSMVHAFRSFYWYVGHRALMRSWLIQYIMLPFVGTTLALAFYLVIRGGFFSPQANLTDTQPFGFVALAVLVGMFSEQAVLKLKEIANTLLTEPNPGSDSVPDEEENNGE